jgi:hypothetical protein
VQQQQGLNAWVVYNTGAYKQFMQGDGLGHAGGLMGAGRPAMTGDGMGRRPAAARVQTGGGGIQVSIGHITYNGPGDIQKVVEAEIAAAIASLTNGDADGEAEL